MKIMILLLYTVEPAITASKGQVKYSRYVQVNVIDR